MNDINDYSIRDISKIRMSNIGDLLVTEKEISEVFFDGNDELFKFQIRKFPLKPIQSSFNKSPTYILREIVPIIKKVYKEF